MPRLETLPRAQIVRRRAVFDATRTQGRRVSNRFVTLNFIPREAVRSSETGTVAFLTPKRLGPATVRTRMRRRLREIHRRHLARADETAYLIWIARPPAIDATFDELREAMMELRGRVR